MFYRLIAFALAVDVFGVVPPLNPLRNCQSVWISQLTDEQRARYYKQLECKNESIASAETFLMFIGYGRSGHTLIGALLDGHPEMIIANEANLLEMLHSSKDSQEALFGKLIVNSVKCSAYGRMQAGYNYSNALLDQGRTQCGPNPHIKVIGDKKGGTTAMRIGRGNAKEILGRLRRRISLPIVFIHVYRNPYDMMASNMAHLVDIKAWQKGHSGHEQTRRPLNNEQLKRLRNDELPNLKLRVSGVEKVRKIVTAQNSSKKRWFTLVDIKYEHFLSDPVYEMEKLCHAINVSCATRYLNDIKASTRNTTHHSYDRYLWAGDIVEKTKTMLKSMGVTGSMFKAYSQPQLQKAKRR